MARASRRGGDKRLCRRRGRLPPDVAARLEGRHLPARTGRRGKEEEQWSPRLRYGRGGLCRFLGLSAPASGDADVPRGYFFFVLALFASAVSRPLSPLAPATESARERPRIAPPLLLLSGE